MPGLNMPGLKIILDSEGCWEDLREYPPSLTQDLEVAGIPGGMASGKPSVMLRLNLPNGTTVLGETSLALFLTAADALRARFGDPRT